MQLPTQLSDVVDRLIRGSRYASSDMIANQTLSRARECRRDSAGISATGCILATVRRHRKCNPTYDLSGMKEELKLDGRDQYLQNLYLGYLGELKRPLTWGCASAE